MKICAQFLFFFLIVKKMIEKSTKDGGAVWLDEVSLISREAAQHPPATQKAIHNNMATGLQPLFKKDRETATEPKGDWETGEEAPGPQHRWG